MLKISGRPCDKCLRKSCHSPATAKARNPDSSRYFCMSEARIPRAVCENSFCWIAVALACSAETVAPCWLQYCSTIASEAEPQPSSVCLTKGTSSHTPASSCASNPGAALRTASSRKQIEKILLRVARFLPVNLQRTARATMRTATMIRMIHSRSRSESVPAAKSFCAWRDFSASFARSSALS
jgi:hypothetical protein